MALPPIAVRTLHNGLKVLAASRRGVPVVELRLRVPARTRTHRDQAVNLLLVQTTLAGTRELSRLELARRIEDAGASLSFAADADAILVSGQVLAIHLTQLLRLLADLVYGASYPDEEVTAERERLIQRLRMARSKASVSARETLLRHLWRTHPYGEYLPDADTVAAITPDTLRAAHAERLVPTGSTLVLVGDIDEAATLDAVESSLGGWTAGPEPAPPMPALPPLSGDVSLLIHRPGSVQSTIRIGGHAVPRDDPRFPALQVANLIYGGYFSSRLVRNIREDKGYTYTPRSRIEHGLAGSSVIIEADVATAVTAPALLEMWYELGRLSTLRPTEQELADARQYAAGTLAMSMGMNAGLATTIMMLDGVGLDVTWINDHPDLLAGVTAEDIYEIGVTVLAPCLLAVVVIGDATRTAAPLRAFGPWEVRGQIDQ
jgi:predicted Zn-dependent peptidase